MANSGVGEVGTMTDLIFLGSRITMDGDCTHEIKRGFLLGRKAMIKPKYHIKKTETPVSNNDFYYIVKAMVYPVSCMDVRVEP